MKRNLPNALFVVCICMAMLPVMLQAQTAMPNGDMETWDAGIGYDNPTGWNSFDSWAAWETSPETTVKKDFLNPFEGLFCAELQSKNITFAGLFNKDVPGALLNADSIRRDPVNALGPLAIYGWGTPWPERPEKVSGYYEYTPTTGDAVFFYAEFWTNDGSGKNVIGTGSFMAGDTVSDYTRFEFDINWTSTDDPDSVGFIFSNTPNLDTPMLGSVLFLDSLSLIYGQMSNYAGSVADDLGLAINVFPNPVTNLMQLENPMEEAAVLTVFNADGREVMLEEMLPGVNQFQVGGLPAGMYLYRIATSELLVADGTFVIK